MPAVTFVRWDRLSERTRLKRYFLVRPDPAVEVRSPSDELCEIAGKFDLYRQAVVTSLWWVGPDRLTVAVCR